ncbi:MAG: 7-carboxy-7-deazaguanine synthase QueE [Candidatus Krumholzibacteria bacterium]|nr:7-carboxy-7-deazaguanine synthase QueE [Candidatus Krumholzibacteria bacterium]
MANQIKNVSNSSAGEPTRTEAVTGYVSEVFCSVQGEGLYVGERHLFLRTAGCTATCYWCDTVSSKQESSLCTVHRTKKESLTNPLSAEQTVAVLLDFATEAVPVRVTITGGEPLEQSDFVTAVARELKRHRLQVYLETNGLEVEGFRKVRPFVDIVAMDIKLPHATGEIHWDTHRDFLRWIVGKSAFVKIVIDSSTPSAEIEVATHLIAEIDRSIPLVLQPEGKIFKRDSDEHHAREKLMGLLDEAQRFALGCLQDVRVIPQCHKILKVR